MTDYDSWLHTYLKHVTDRNPFVALLDMQVTTLRKGEATITIPVSDKHTNPYGVVHGGALAALADTAMGMACSTLGNRVWTIEMNTNFIKNVRAGSSVIATAKVIHSGKTTMVAEVEICSDDQKLLVKGRATFYVVGRYEPTENIAPE